MVNSIQGIGLISYIRRLIIEDSYFTSIWVLINGTLYHRIFLIEDNNSCNMLTQWCFLYANSPLHLRASPLFLFPMCRKESFTPSITPRILPSSSWRLSCIRLGIQIEEICKHIIRDCNDCLQQHSTASVCYAFYRDVAVILINWSEMHNSHVMVRFELYIILIRLWSI